MVQVGYPLAKTLVETPQQWSAMAQNWLSTGVIKGKLNELSVYADSTGMQCKVKTGQAFIQGHFFQSDTTEVVLPIATADPTNPRIDRIIVRLDYTSDSISLVVLQGVPAVSPAAPALTQNDTRWEISLGQIRVNAAVTTITAGNVSDERLFGNVTPYFYYKGVQLGNIATASTLLQLPWGAGGNTVQNLQGCHLSGNSLIIDVPGIYIIECQADISGLNNQVSADVTIRKTFANASPAEYESHFVYGWSGLGSNYGSSQQGAVPIQHSVIKQMAVGDSIDFFVRCGEAPRNTNGYWFRGWKISN